MSLLLIVPELSTKTHVMDVGTIPNTHLIKEIGIGVQ
jgi:hypothetical protein